MLTNCKDCCCCVMLYSHSTSVLCNADDTAETIRLYRILL